jgi:hypothetical protein
VWPFAFAPSARNSRLRYEEATRPSPNVPFGRNSAPHRQCAETGMYMNA